jgi:hypothetical protein
MLLVKKSVSPSSGVGAKRRPYSHTPSLVIYDPETVCPSSPLTGIPFIEIPHSYANCGFKLLCAALMMMRWKMEPFSAVGIM